MPLSRLAPLVLALLPATATAQPLPGTAPWEDRGDPPADMVAGLHRYLDRATVASVASRARHWHRDLSSIEAYGRSVAPNRARLQAILGAVGERASPVALSFVSGPDAPAKVAETESFSAFAVRWDVYPGVAAEGLWLEPRGEPRALVVAMADCAVTPEQFAGLSPGLEPPAQVARLMAEAGSRVLVPTLLDRSDAFSGNPKVRMTNLPHREWLYRMAYEAGRHPIGYEVDAVRAAVDWLTREGQPDRPVGVVGHGEGGRIALYAAALDPRIDVAWVAGAFGPREGVWAEPIDRNVWGLLDEFGDAEVASLIAPRSLRVEPCLAPEVPGPPPPRDGRSDAASGRLTSPDPAAVRAEVARARDLVRGLPRPDGAPEPIQVVGGEGPMNRDGAALRDVARLLGLTRPADRPASPPAVAGPLPDPRARTRRLLEGYVAYTQSILRTSELRRYEYWSKADSSSPERWAETSGPYRERFREEVIGSLPPASEPLEARTWKVYDEPKWAGYAVQLPVWPDVVASGVLLLPKDLKDGERRPVVVCQHGLEGTPTPVVDRRVESPYNAFGARLADLGYIVYAPQNPYIGRDAFRTLQRKANPLKASLFSIIVRQHERTLEWLSSLPAVDPGRIAFYGLSYGGKTAMRVPALVEGYCLSICSADFNEWVVKCTNLDRKYSYLYTIEYDMYEFGLSEGYNYAEMAGLIAPRPFMVERGHGDGVAPDEWIGYEYAKVKRLYDALGLPDRTGLALFNGGHMIHGEETFAFLARHLRWPEGGRD